MRAACGAADGSASGWSRRQCSRLRGSPVTAPARKRNTRRTGGQHAQSAVRRHVRATVIERSQRTGRGIASGAGGADVPDRIEISDVRDAASHVFYVNPRGHNRSCDLSGSDTRVVRFHSAAPGPSADACQHAAHARATQRRPRSRPGRHIDIRAHHTQPARRSKHAHNIRHPDISRSRLSTTRARRRTMIGRTPGYCLARGYTVIAPASHLVGLPRPRP